LLDAGKAKLKIELVNKFNMIRKRGYRGDRSETAPLLYILGYDGMRTTPQMEALLIKFVDKLIPDERDKDILLMSFRLLKGYEGDDMLELEPRYKQYVINSKFLTAKETAAYTTGDEAEREKIVQTAYERLRKNGKRLLSKLASAIVFTMGTPNFNMSAFITEVEDYLQKTAQGYCVKYPRPYYLKEKPCFDDHLPDAMVLTPNAPRWGKSGIFSGRDALVDTLCRDLQTGLPHLQLTGMGGVGKTAILTLQRTQ
jgi:hypothetical protein